MCFLSLFMAILQSPYSEGAFKMSFHPLIRLALLLCLIAGITQQMLKPNNYPPARKSDQVDDYHGVKVADPYRWLEDLDSEETRAWVEAENKLSFAYLAAIPARTALKDRLTKLWNYEKYGFPFKEGKDRKSVV